MRTTESDTKQTEKLRKNLRGTILHPGDEEYNSARRIWNGMIDKHPAMIVRCTGAADVMAAVRFAREQGLPVGVRGGGHNVAGSSVIDGGLIIDLSLMRSVRADPSRSVVRVDGGALLGDIDHETQAFGKAVPVGAVSETGIGGLALHGGFGFLTRKYGLTADNLVSADVVTADGSLITTDRDNHPDLFWALRGGGGSFGAVTSFEFRMHPVGPEIYFVITFYPVTELAGVFRFFRSYMPGAPDELMAVAIGENAPDKEFIPERYRGEPVIIVAGCWCGPLNEGERATQPMRRIAGPIADLSGPMPYLETQRLFDADYPKGDRYYWKSLYLDELGDDIIRLAAGAMADRASPRSGVVLWALGGAMGRVPRDSTAYFHRDAPYLLSIESNDSDPATDQENIAWVRRWHEKASQLTRRGTYLNFGGFWEGGEELLAGSFGTNFTRLREVKNRYDPENIFGQNLKFQSGSKVNT